MIITAQSHLDHGLTAEHLQYLFKLYGDRQSFFIETIDLPSRLSMVSCSLYGPIMGDAPVRDRDTIMWQRNGRTWASRLLVDPSTLDLTRPQASHGPRPRPTRQLTIIAGPHEAHACILYTAFGGPLAPKEPGDPTLSEADRAASVEFWAQHALVG